VLAIADMALLYAQHAGQVPDLLRDAEDLEKRLSSVRLTPVNRLERHAKDMPRPQKRATRERSMSELLGVEVQLLSSHRYAKS
jgi:hypothetical protein